MNTMRFNEGYWAAQAAIAKDGDTQEAVRHHRGVASGDLEPDEFTQGWKQACDDALRADVQTETPEVTPEVTPEAAAATTESKP